MFAFVYVFSFVLPVVFSTRHVVGVPEFRNARLTESFYSSSSSYYDSSSSYLSAPFFLLVLLLCFLFFWPVSFSYTFSVAKAIEQLHCIAF